ncbi:MAG: hypothetical protein WC729_14470 [Sphingomonas sp.]|jgi:hypothetical protein|uniref:hypothetical protein n=1 Tax=Sphingomonas sp. TaxID=28214 RepID=UPI0035672BDF
MQNLTLGIEGEWWDSLLYKGRLHLFGMDGSLQTFDWERLIRDLGEQLPAGSSDAFRFAFAESNALYRAVIDGADLKQSFAALDAERFEVSKRKLFDYLIEQGDTRFPFPHASSTVYYDRMLVASPEGIHGAIYDPFQDRLHGVKRLTELPANQAWPAYNSVAIAGGSEGLYEIDLGLAQDEWLEPRKPTLISSRATDACDWMFKNIVAMSIDSGSFLARYDSQSLESFDPLVDEPQAEDEGGGATLRVLSEVDDLDAILPAPSRGGSSFVWGSQDKFYKAESGRITAFRFLRDGRIIRAGSVAMRHGIEALVSVQTSLFGVVLEFDTGLLVLTSDEVAHDIPGEPVNWRVFPRSRRYENHLHVIGDDKLTIHSFNHDADVDQFTKVIGSKYYDRAET